MIFCCRGQVSHYALFIAEDDGSPDADFPCLEPREVVGKFGFTTLALVRVSSPKKEAPASSPTSTPLPESNRPNNESAETVLVNSHAPITVLESTDFHSFTGFLLHKVRPKTEISLGKLGKSQS
jgi:target of rapamycin complex 2 subunit MAPKAP1